MALEASSTPRQRDPELESACPAGIAGAAAVPCTAIGLEPFDATLGQQQNPNESRSAGRLPNI
jgi:hypothetical protein